MMHHHMKSMIPWIVNLQFYVINVNVDISKFISGSKNGKQDQERIVGGSEGRFKFCKLKFDRDII